MGPMLVMLQAPKVEIARDSWAGAVLENAGDVRGPRGLAAWGGFGGLGQHRLPAGDAEVRVWGGFGLGNLEGTILRRKGSVWTAVRLVGAYPGTRSRPRKVAYAAPKGGWPAFWRKAEAFGIWSLPDESTLPQAKRMGIDDGISYLVETQRDGRYRAYAYNNPALQTGWPEAARMARLAWLLELSFPLPTRG